MSRPRSRWRAIRKARSWWYGKTSASPPSVSRAPASLSPASSRSASTWRPDYPEPEIARDPEGFVVVWDDDDGSGYGVFARRFDPAGEPLTGTLQVNAATARSQSRPAVASFDDGSFLVAWQGLRPLPGIAFDVFARRFSGAGEPLYDELQINVSTAGTSLSPQRTEVGLDAEGNAVVVWGSTFRRLSSSGELLGDEIAFGSRRETVAVDDDGSFVVAWGQGFFTYDVTDGHFGQHFSSSGEPVGGCFRVNPGVRLIDRGAGPIEAAGLGGGDFVVAYQKSTLYGFSYGTIYGRRLPADARAGTIHFAPLTPNFLPEPGIDWAAVESPGAVELTVLRSGGNLGEVTVDCFFDGGSAVPGEDFLGAAGQLTFRDDELPWQTLRLQLVDDLIPEGAEDIVLRLAEPTGGAELLSPETACLRIYDADFNPPELAPIPLGGELVVSSYPGGRLSSPRVAISPRGDLVVIWERRNADNDLEGLYGRLYGPNGQPRGGEFRLHSDSPDTQSAPDVAFGEDSGFLVLWHERDPASGKTTVVAHRFNASGAPRTAKLPVLSCAQVPDPTCIGMGSRARPAPSAAGRSLLTASFNFPPAGSRSDVVRAILDPDGTVTAATLGLPGRNFDPAIASTNGTSTAATAGRSSARDYRSWSGGSGSR